MENPKQGMCHNKQSKYSGYTNIRFDLNLNPMQCFFNQFYIFFYLFEGTEYAEK